MQRCYLQPLIDRQISSVSFSSRRDFLATDLSRSSQRKNLIGSCITLVLNFIPVLDRQGLQTLVSRHAYLLGEQVSQLRVHVLYKLSANIFRLLYPFAWGWPWPQDRL